MLNAPRTIAISETMEALSFLAAIPPVTTDANTERPPRVVGTPLKLVMW